MCTRTGCCPSEYYSWVTVTDLAVEQRILDEYRILAHGLISYYDENYPIYGMISTIDGDMRLRLRDEESVKSSTDNRYVRRGKNMRSIKKEYLNNILNMLEKTETEANTQGVKMYSTENFSINEMAKRIDDALVNNRLYIVV